MSKSKEQFIKQREDERILEDTDYQYEQYLKLQYLNNIHNHNNKKNGKAESKKREVQK